jgi:hypothetical protein
MKGIRQVIRLGHPTLRTIAAPFSPEEIVHPTTSMFWKLDYVALLIV